MVVNKKKNKKKTEWKKEICTFSTANLFMEMNTQSIRKKKTTKIKWVINYSCFQCRKKTYTRSNRMNLDRDSQVGEYFKLPYGLLLFTFLKSKKRKEETNILISLGLMEKWLLMQKPHQFCTQSILSMSCHRFTNNKKGRFVFIECCFSSMRIFWSTVCWAPGTSVTILTTARKWASGRENIIETHGNEHFRSTLPLLCVPSSWCNANTKKRYYSIWFSNKILLD